MNYSEMLFNRDEKLIDKIKELEEENKRLKESIVNLIKDDSDLQLRINKAIEYIKNCIDSEDIYEQFMSTGETKELLKILNKAKENKKIEKIDISKFPKRNNSLKKTALKLNEIIDKINGGE